MEKESSCIEEVFDNSAPETKAEIVDKFKAIVAGREDVNITNSEMDFAFANNHYKISEDSFNSNIGRNLGGRIIQPSWSALRYEGNPFAAALGGYTRKPAITGSQVRVKYMGPDDSNVNNRRAEDTETMFSSAFIGTRNPNFDNLSSAPQVSPYLWHQNVPIHQIQQSLPDEYLDDADPDDIMSWLELFELTAQRRENLAFVRNDDTNLDTYANAHKLLLGPDGLRGVRSYGTSHTNSEFSLHTTNTDRHIFREFEYSRDTNDTVAPITDDAGTTFSVNNLAQAIKLAIKRMPDYCYSDMVMIAHKSVLFLLRNINSFSVPFDHENNMLRDGGTGYRYQNWEPIGSNPYKDAYFFGAKTYVGYNMSQPFQSVLNRGDSGLRGHQAYVFCPDKRHFEWTLYGDNQIKRNTQYIPGRTVFTLTRRPFVTNKNPHTFKIVTIS